MHLGPPKSRASRRVIPLPATVVDALREHRERQDADREMAGDRSTETGLVFPSPLGGHVSPRTLAAQWHVIRTAAGLGRMRFHDLRHTAFDPLVLDDHELGAVAAFLGSDKHRGISTITDIHH